MTRMALSICCLWLAQFATAAVGAPHPRARAPEDKFPAGSATPEGAACDLARAFITADAARFRAVVIRSYGPPAYVAFIDRVVNEIQKEAAAPAPSPEGPRAISKVFAARHLS